jgi:hypothetical protein
MGRRHGNAVRRGRVAWVSRLSGPRSAFKLARRPSSVGRCRRPSVVVVVVVFFFLSSSFFFSLLRIVAVRAGAGLGGGRVHLGSSNHVIFTAGLTTGQGANDGTQTLLF